MRGLRVTGTRGSLVAALALLILPPAGEAAAPRPAAHAGPVEALVSVRTLVIDGLGTRTVDADVARIPAGGTGLLVKQVPYAGPDLSFRLAVRVGDLQQSGLPLTLSTQVWAGEAHRPPPAELVARREEATLLGLEGSYLLEIDHAAGADRRIVLSISARPARPDDAPLPIPPQAALPVQLVLDLVREVGGAPGPAERHVLSTLLGQSASLSSSVKRPAPRLSRADDAAQAPQVGLHVVVTPERALAGLVTVRVEIQAADVVDAAAHRIERLRHSEVHTIPWGSTFLVAVEPPPPEPGEDRREGPGRTAYRIAVTPERG